MCARVKSQIGKFQDRILLTVMAPVTAIGHRLPGLTLICKTHLDNTIHFQERRTIPMGEMLY